MKDNPYASPRHSSGVLEEGWLERGIRRPVWVMGQLMRARHVGAHRCIQETIAFHGTQPADMLSIIGQLRRLADRAPRTVYRDTGFLLAPVLGYRIKMRRFTDWFRREGMPHLRQNGQPPPQFLIDGTEVVAIVSRF